MENSSRTNIWIQLTFLQNNIPTNWSDKVHSTKVHDDAFRMVSRTLFSPEMKETASRTTATSRSGTLHTALNQFPFLFHKTNDTAVLPWIIKHRSGPRLVSESWQLMDSGCEHRGEYPDHATDSLTAVRETRIRALIRSSRSWQSGKFRVASTPPRRKFPRKTFVTDDIEWFLRHSSRLVAGVRSVWPNPNDEASERIVPAAPLLLSFLFFGLDELSLPLGARQLEFSNVGQDVAEVLFVTALARSWYVSKGAFENRERFSKTPTLAHVVSRIVMTYQRSTNFYENFSNF